MTPYNLDSVHEDIRTIYQWWAIQAPDVHPQEDGTLAALWSVADRLVEDNRGNLTPEQFESEFGRGNKR